MPSASVVCPRCGIFNPSGRIQCLNCGQRLDSDAPVAPLPTLPPPPSAIIPAASASPVVADKVATGKIYYPRSKHTEYLPGRPGWVTLYIVWQIVSLVITYWSSPLLAFRIQTADLRDVNSNSIFMLVVIGFFEVAFLVSLVGLLYMKNWARVVQMLYLILSLIMEIALLATSLSSLTFDTFIIIVVPQTLLAVVPLWLFVTNHRQFS